jgi:hypothetical protein
MFLYDILRHCGGGLVLLCATSLGKQRIITMNEPERIRLVQFVRTNKASLQSSTLDSLAIKYQIPHDNSMLHILFLGAEANSQEGSELTHLEERPRKRARSEGMQYCSYLTINLRYFINRCLEIEVVDRLN